nr:DUF21 domain-containing protein At1g47330-like isoform X1 [Ipomoea batatas]
MSSIVTMGHSRVPVYHIYPTNIVGLILVKNLLAILPEDSIAVRKMMGFRRYAFV